MTVEKLKVEAAKLPADDRLALAEWIEKNEDILELRRAALMREIQIGLNELECGNYVECRGDEELRSFFNGVKARGRELHSTREEPAA